MIRCAINLFVLFLERRCALPNSKMMYACYFKFIRTPMSIVDCEERCARVTRQGEYVHMRIFHLDAPSLHAGATDTIIAVPAAGRFLLRHRFAERLPHPLALTDEGRSRITPFNTSTSHVMCDERS